MSKSVGNVVAPEEIIKKYGADILRLWVAAADYRDDVRVSGQILDGLAEGYRKIRNTVRWALGNLDGFDPARDAVPVAEMEPFDRWAYARLVEWQDKVAKAYDDYEFHVAYHATIEFVRGDPLVASTSTWSRTGSTPRARTARRAAAPRRCSTWWRRTCSACSRRCSPSPPTRPGSTCPAARPESVFEAGLPTREPPGRRRRARRRATASCFEVRAEVHEGARAGAAATSSSARAWRRR